jgi:hypothetical protein
MREQTAGRPTAADEAVSHFRAEYQRDKQTCAEHPEHGSKCERMSALYAQKCREGINGLDDELAAKHCE